MNLHVISTNGTSVMLYLEPSPLIQILTREYFRCGLHFASSKSLALREHDISLLLHDEYVHQQ